MTDKKNMKIEDRIKANNPDEYYDLRMLKIENVSKRDVYEFMLGYPEDNYTKKYDKN